MRLRHHSRRVMATDVEETTNNIVTASNNDDWLAGDFRGDVLTGRLYLINTADHVPGISEDCLQLQSVEAFICVPR
jgi:hypothetical protein